VTKSISPWTIGEKFGLRVPQSGLKTALQLRWKFFKSQIQRGNMKARTSVLIIFVASVFVLATVSHGYPAQITSGQERPDKQNQPGNNPNINNDLSGSENGQKGMTNEAGSQGETPRVAKTLQPVIIRHIGWGWLIISGLIGFLLGRITNFRKRSYGRDEDIPRNRAA